MGIPLSGIPLLIEMGISLHSKMGLSPLQNGAFFASGWGYHGAITKRLITFKQFDGFDLNFGCNLRPGLFFIFIISKVKGQGHTSIFKLLIQVKSLPFPYI